MAVHSGKFGAIDIANSVRDWTINDNMTPSEYIVSGSLGARVRTEGIRNWDGSYNQLTGEPALLPGETGAAKFFTAPNDDVSGAGVTGSGNILVSQLDVNWDWSGSEAVNCAVTFVGDGALTWGDDTVTDTSIPNPLSICPTKIESSPNGTVWTAIPNLASATLSLMYDTVDYVNSSTNCTTGRKPGPQDWTLALTQQDNVRGAADPFEIGDLLYLRCWIDDTLYWYLAFGLVRDFTGLTVNIETGDIISRTINIDMTATDGTVLGGVISPGGTKWWNSAFTPPV